MSNVSVCKLNKGELAFVKTGDYWTLCVVRQNLTSPNVTSFFSVIDDRHIAGIRDCPFLWRPLNEDDMRTILCHLTSQIKNHGLAKLIAPETVKTLKEIVSGVSEPNSTMVDSEKPWTPLSEGLPDIGRPFKMRHTTNSSVAYFENCRLVKKLESGDYVWEITDVGDVALNVNSAWASTYQWRYLDAPAPETEEPWTPLSEELPDSDTYIELKCHTELGDVNYQPCQLKTWYQQDKFEWCIEGPTSVPIVGMLGYLKSYQWRYQQEK